MSRYRKIEVRTWADEGFRRLSAIKPSGQALWFYLLTGPHTGPIPGLFRAGRAAMAEELDWDIEDFDKAFLEVFENGMAKADFKARLVWLPNALKHNKPESPNVVRSWRVELDLLPECALKNEAVARIREVLESIGPSYVQAFDETLRGESRKPSPKPLGKPSIKTTPNQEQEQEQEQEYATPQAAKPKQKRAPSKTPLSESFCISERVKAWAEEKGHQFLDLHFDHFVSACKRRGYTYADWDEAFMSAVRDNWAKIDPAKLLQFKNESARPPKPDGDYVWVEAQGKWVHRNFLGVK